MTSEIEFDLADFDEEPEPAAHPMEVLPDDNILGTDFLTDAEREVEELPSIEAKTKLAPGLVIAGNGAFVIDKRSLAQVDEQDFTDEYRRGVESCNDILLEARAAFKAEHGRPMTMKDKEYWQASEKNRHAYNAMSCALGRSSIQKPWWDRRLLPEIGDALKGDDAPLWAVIASRTATRAEDSDGEAVSTGTGGKIEVEDLTSDADW